MAPLHATALAHRGVNYCVGTNYPDGGSTRELWRSDLVRREIRAIRDELHCTSVNVYGTELSRLVEGATIALEDGLDVWLQPRLIEASPEDTIDHLVETARAAELLREQYPRLILNVGCELSLYASGIVPGNDFTEKGFPLESPRWWPLLPLFNKRLNVLLARVARAARSTFGGRITYGAGLWESVDWTAFDIVGLNYYRHEFNRDSYAADLRRQHRHGKPVAVLEFGCGSYQGADDHGPRAHGFVDWSVEENRQVVMAEHTRDETVQARYLADLVEIYRREGVYGAFAFEFIQPSSPHSPEPRYDLDMVDYSIVKVLPDDSDRPYSSGYWEPKAAFHEIAGRYRELSRWRDSP